MGHIAEPSTTRPIHQPQQHIAGPRTTRPIHQPQQRLLPPPPRLSFHNLPPAAAFALLIPSQMTIASLGTPARGGPSCSTSPAPPARGALLDARNQEKAANSGCQDSEAPMLALALPPPPPRIQEPEKLKRRRDAYSAKVIRVSKKQGSAVVAAPGLGKVNCAAAPSSPIIREQDGNRGHGAPGVEHKEEEKVRPCEFAATAYDQEEECCLIKKSCCSAMAAACSGTNNGAVGHQVNSARRRVRKNTKPSECKKIYVSLTSCLRSLGVTKVTPVLAKILTLTDSNLNQARLQISPLKFMKSPLLSMLTPDEYADVHTDKGLPVKALDRHGYSYDTALGFAWLSSNITYRLKTGWASFLRRSGVRDGDLVEIGAFRAHGRLMLTLLNYTLDGSIPEEMEAVEGLLMLSDFKDGTNKALAATMHVEEGTVVCE